MNRLSVRIQLVIAIVAVAVTVQPFVQYLRISGPARTAASALRSSSVYVAPGQDAVIEKAHVQKVIGDRPILVAVMGKDFTGDVLKACEGIAKIQSSSIVLAYKGPDHGAPPAICAGSAFPTPDVPGPAHSDLGSKTDVWLSFNLGRIAQDASEFRVAGKALDRTPEVEELVLAFDSQAAQDYPHGVPRRSTHPDRFTVLTFLLDLFLVAVALVVVSLLLQWIGRLLLEGRSERRGIADQRAEVTARLSQAGERILGARPDAKGREAVRQATAGELYVQALTAVEAARSEKDLAEAGTLVDAVLAASRR